MAQSMRRIMGVIPEPAASNRRVPFSARDEGGLNDPRGRDIDNKSPGRREHR